MIALALTGVPEAMPATPSVPDRPAPSCPNCRQLNAELQAAQARLEALEKKLQQLESDLRRSQRQAAPFAREHKKKVRKRPGRRTGEGKFSYREKPADSVVEQTLVVPLGGCPCCGGAALKDVKTHEQFEVDIPPIKPRWRRYLFQSGYCGACKKRVYARHPEQLSLATGAAGVVVGPRAKALAADLKHRLGLPLRKSAELLRCGFGLQVTASALCQANARLAIKTEPLYGEIAETIATSAAVYADDTGWRIAGEPAWLWVFAAPEATLYAIDRRRSHEVAHEILSEEFAGVLVSDCAPAFDHRRLSHWTKQKCFAHLLKDLRQMEDQKARGAVRFPRAVAEVLREALGLGRERQAVPAELFQARRQELEQRLDRLICPRRRLSDPDNARFAKRLRKQREHLFTFLSHEGVEATNNRAERMLRPGVITRKTGGCNRSAPGARTHEILASILVTLSQQGRDILGYLSDVLRASGPLPELFPAPTPSTT